jgi:hypothetical protein
MQCILYKIYFLEGFSYILQIDMHFICTPMWTKFYSCKKWVLHSRTLRWLTVAIRNKQQKQINKQYTKQCLMSKKIVPKDATRHYERMSATVT